MEQSGLGVTKWWSEASHIEDTTKMEEAHEEEIEKGVVIDQQGGEEDGLLHVKDQGESDSE